MNNNRLEDSAKFYCHMGLLLLALVGVTWCLLLLKYAIPISFAETGLMADLLLGVIITGSLAYLCLRIKKQGLAARTEFDMLFLKNPYPMWIYDVASLKFLQVNDAACSMYGYSREEFLNMTIAEIRPAEDVPALLNETEQVRAEFSLGYMWSGTWRHKKKDGTMIYSEISSHKIIFQGRRAL
jgi:PAS domain S-box-containing protein